MFDKIPGFLKNKYILVLVIAMIWLLFFDQNNMVQQYRLSQELKHLNNEREFFIEEIQRDSTDIMKIKNDPLELERYAREQYLMKKENEDIFIIRE